MRILRALHVAFLTVLYSCASSTNDSSSSQGTSNSTYSISKEDSILYINEGTRIVKQMYVGILTHLNKALDELGPYEAVKYCNTKALPLTDSLATHYGIQAKRTSLKIRNAANAPDSLEKQVLLMYEKTQSKKPMLIATKNNIKFFTPIFIAHVCLTCHGEPNVDISDVTMTALHKWYPQDQAKNYKLYDIRGIWSITFPKNYSSTLSSQTTQTNP